MGLFSWMYNGGKAMQSSNASDQAFSGDLETVPRSNTICYHLEGFLACENFRKALSLSQRVVKQSEESGIVTVHVDVNAFPRDEFFETRLKELHKIKNSGRHITSPFIYEGCEAEIYSYVGDYDAFKLLTKERHDVS